MESSLSDDLLMLIFFKLPAKSLIRLKSVSKSWREIISSPSFIYHHYNHASSAADASEEKRSSFLVLHSPLRSELHNYFTRLSVSVTDGQFRCKNDETFYLHYFRKKWEAWPYDVPLIYAAGFGIYCIFSFRVRMVALWNPTITQLKFLPLSPFHSRRKRDSYVYGFAHVEYKDGVFSYKVGLLRRRFVERVCHESIELYSSSENSWKLLDKCCSLKRAGKLCSVNGWLHSGTVLNDKFHWLTWLDEEDTHIVTLDMSTEEISRFEIPTFLRHDSRYNLAKSLLTKFEEKYLCLLLYWENNVNAVYLDVWMMVEYGITGSWTRKSTTGPISNPEYVNVLGISNSVGGLVIQGLGLGHDGGLFFCQYDSSNVLRLLSIPSDVIERALFVEDKESLVSFGGGSDKRTRS